MPNPAFERDCRNARQLLNFTLGIMNDKISWGDLFITEPSLDYVKIFSCWPQFSVWKVRPIGMSAFGDCYFERDDGSVHVLDPIAGEIRFVANSVDDFSKFMNTHQ